MSEAKHTPGPWVIGEISHKKQHVEIDAPFGDPTLGCAAWSGLARVYGCNDDKNAGSNVMEANARLIAAAPELLEALLVAHKRITEDRASYVWGVELPDGSMDTKDAAILHEAYDSKLAQIEAAIAKATAQQ